MQGLPLRRTERLHFLSSYFPGKAVTLAVERVEIPSDGGRTVSQTACRRQQLKPEKTETPAPAKAAEPEVTTTAANSDVRPVDLDDANDETIITITPTEQ